MLGEVDLNKNLSKKEYKEMMDVLAPKFSALQREARKKGLPQQYLLVIPILRICSCNSYTVKGSYL